MDWVMVINEERIENELLAFPRINIMLYVKSYRSSLTYGGSVPKYILGKQRHQESKTNANFLLRKQENEGQNNGTTERVRLHFEHPSYEETLLNLMKKWIKTSDAVLRQQQKKQQRDQLRNHLITDYFNRLIRQASTFQKVPGEYIGSRVPTAATKSPASNGWRPP